jgi:hypothetical protein
MYKKKHEKNKEKKVSWWTNFLAIDSLWLLFGYNTSTTSNMILSYISCKLVEEPTGLEAN